MSELATTEDLANLKALADEMGLTYHPSIGIEKLRDKIVAAQKAASASDDGDEPSTDAPAPEKATAPAAPVATETEAERRKRLKMQALELVRIRLTCLNPAKKEWEGEIITVGNRLVGTVAKFVPFNADEGWHVPRIMLEVLQTRQCQVFSTVKSKNGVSVRQGKLIKEFAIEVLPQLTQAELRDLAQRQAMAAGQGA